MRNLSAQKAPYEEVNAVPSPPHPARRIDSMRMFFLPNLSMVPEMIEPKMSPLM